VRLALAISASLLLASSVAHADETIVVQPPAASSPSPRVRASFHAYKGRPTRIYAETTSERYALVCGTPCEADLYPGARLRAVYDGNEEEPHDFVIEGNAGGKTDVEIRPASKGPLAGGIVMTSIGGVTALVGIVLLAVASSTKIHSADYQTAGLVTSVIGGGLTIGGILIIVNRSHEPRVRQDPAVQYYKGKEASIGLGFAF
jgi:hypothetical protein